MVDTGLIMNKKEYEEKIEELRKSLKEIEKENQILIEQLKIISAALLMEGWKRKLRRAKQNSPHQEHNLRLGRQDSARAHADYHNHIKLKGGRETW